MPSTCRDQLIDSAMRVFYRNGFHNTGIEMVLKDASVSRMTLYNHFRSKNELIVAAMRRRDEIFRNKMMKYIDSHSDSAIERIFAVFDYHREWFVSDDFCGCMFINASAEFADPASTVRQASAAHKNEIIRFLHELCTKARLQKPMELARQLNLLIDGAIVMAHVISRAGGDVANRGEAAELAKKAASELINFAPGLER